MNPHTTAAAKSDERPAADRDTYLVGMTANPRRTQV